MPAQFFKLSKRLIKACPDDWIVTPNERLAREFTRAYDAHRFELGQSAWATPRVASINRFIAARAAQSPACSDPRQPLSADAELLLWQEVADTDSAAFCELAADAWRLLHAYRIGLDDEAFGGTANARTFRRWARRFRARLRADSLVTQAELADRLPGATERLHMVAFDVITPQVADFLRRTEAAGGVVRHHLPRAMRNGPRKRVQTDGRSAEIHAAAQWARRVLTRYPTAHIGIVFPYLTDAYFAIAHTFEVEFADAPGAVDISGGTPLGEQPIWRDAARLLRLATGEIGHRELERLRLSAWLDLGTPLKLPRDIPEMLQMQHLTTASEVLRELAGRARECPRRQSFAGWIETFRSLLAIVGWNGSNAASGQYQAFVQLSESLQRFSRISQLPGLSGADALQTLQRLLSNRLFAPERPPAPVQVLGYLETAGLVFTHLWVAGLQDTAWPAAPSPNPLLPIPLQRHHGVPRSDHAMEAGFAMNQTRLWQRASRYMVTSHAVDDGDEQHRCSSLVETIAPSPVGKLIPGYRQRRHPWLSEPVEARLDPVTEVRGSALQETLTHGGTSVLRDQAQCPFRAWAVHRLNLVETRDAQNFPDALERGTLIHEALCELYANGTRPFGEADMERAVTAALAGNLGQAPDLYRHNEQLRVRRLLRAWVDFEARRPDFSIVGLERKAGLVLPGLQLTLRIDRIDRDPETGLQVVIDYKTGNVSARPLQADRLTEPQLPMYALTDAGIRSTLYAQVGSNAMALKGLASEEIDLGKSRVQKLPRADWDALTARWKIQVEALAGEFRAGYAAVQPSSPSVCDHCHLPSFCRVYAGARAAAVNAEPGSRREAP